MSILVIMVNFVIRIIILVIFFIMTVITIKGALRKKIVENENIVVKCVKATSYICICKRQVSQYLY